jgi:ribosomal protein S18 acetylase RimI-like enzyme
MDSAIHLYRGTGFYEIPAYYANPIPTAIYFEKKLGEEKPVRPV